MTAIGFIERQRAFWLRTLGLTPFDVRNLVALYFATFIMRAAAFAGVAVMQHVVFPDRADALWKGLLFAVYPVAEITTVGYFGTLCDRSGRKRILVFAHLITAAAVFLFIVGIGLPADVEPYAIAAFFAMFGLGAAAKVASTLAMVNDHSSLENRAQLMAVFDLVTFGGLVGGFGFGFLALNAWGWDPAVVLLLGGIGVTLSVIMIQFLVSDAKFIPAPPISALGLLRVVFRNRDILRLLPVYIPVVALYGYVLTFTDQLIAGQAGGRLLTSHLIAVVLAFGIPLALSLGVSGRWSDKSRLRKPFMLLGLTCFGGLAILFSLATQPGGGMDLGLLYDWIPFIVLLAAGAGTFPPAALAYLGDIIERSMSGTSFGVYSIIFGSGLIVGPILGGGLTQALGPLAFAIVSLSLIAVSGTAVLFLRESARSPTAATPAVTAADPPQMRP
ncbi:MAG TPA: MFS transporter [Thermoplasmata archaeon]|nr:MFS transporter [Thermoplasmata archaeon]